MSDSHLRFDLHTTDGTAIVQPADNETAKNLLVGAYKPPSKNDAAKAQQTAANIGDEFCKLGAEQALKDLVEDFRTHKNDPRYEQAVVQLLSPSTLIALADQEQHDVESHSLVRRIDTALRIDTPLQATFDEINATRPKIVNGDPDSQNLSSGENRQAVAASENQYSPTTPPDHGDESSMTDAATMPIREQNLSQEDQATVETTVRQIKTSIDKQDPEAALQVLVKYMKEHDDDAHKLAVFNALDQQTSAALEAQHCKDETTQMFRSLSQTDQAAVKQIVAKITELGPDKSSDAAKQALEALQQDRKDHPGEQYGQVVFNLLDPAIRKALVQDARLLASNGEAITEPQSDQSLPQQNPDTGLSEADKKSVDSTVAAIHHDLDNNDPESALQAYTKDQKTHKGSDTHQAAVDCALGKQTKDALDAQFYKDDAAIAFSLLSKDDQKAAHKLILQITSMDPLKNPERALEYFTADSKKHPGVDRGLSYSRAVIESLGNQVMEALLEQEEETENERRINPVNNTQTGNR